MESALGFYVFYVKWTSDVNVIQNLIMCRNKQNKLIKKMMYMIAIWIRQPKTTDISCEEPNKDKTHYITLNNPTFTLFLHNSY